MMNNKTIAIIGNPNCGKTVIFNALTGSRQKVGNWAGVTVDRKSGTYEYKGINLTVVDLPGVYSLSVTEGHTAQDERIACEYILSHQADVIVNVIDASNLERNLYLTAQLLEMQVPIVIALNMMDIAQRRGIHIDTELLAQTIGCPVVSLVANKGSGIKLLQYEIFQAHAKPHRVNYELPASVQQAFQHLCIFVRHKAAKYDCAWFAQRLLEEDALALELIDEKTRQEVQLWREQIQQAELQESDLLFANARSQWAMNLSNKIIQQKRFFKSTLTELIDQVVLNRWLGIPIFFLVMYVMFFFAINIGGAFQDFFNISSTTIFIKGLSHVLAAIDLPNWTIAILANGVGKGINTTITFIPVIGGMFLFLSFLEDSGYMARAAFVVDRLMRAIGLPGKAFVPLIVGFGCNVPAVMATRTLGSQRDRIVTIMMSPFMSCGARLAIYALFVSAFFPHGGQNIIFILYLVGVVTAILTGVLLRMTHLRGHYTPLVLELPAYHIPHLRVILRSSGQRLKMFLLKAGKFIIPVCIIIGLLNGVSTSGKLIEGEAGQHSLLSAIGKAVTPVFAPLGLQHDNWPATVGLATGILAKEVVVGTLNTLYSQVGDIQYQEKEFDFVGGLQDAVMSIPKDLVQLSDAWKNPVLASAPIQDINQSVYGVMANYFDGQAGAFTYLLFILLYFPCVSTMAVMRREISAGWTYFSMFWTTGLAYGGGTIFYQAARWHRHPFSSSLWIGGFVLLLAGIMAFMRWHTGKMPKGRRVIAIAKV